MVVNCGSQNRKSYRTGVGSQASTSRLACGLRVGFTLLHILCPFATPIVRGEGKGDHKDPHHHQNLFSRAGSWYMHNS
jgi:hypothetical protein